MIYDTSKNIDKHKAIERLNKLISQGAIVELTEKRTRSLNQNSYLHLILSWFSIEYGCSLEYTKTTYFKQFVNREIFEIEKVSIKSGRRFKDYRSTSSLTTEEMSRAIERFRNWSGENGIYLPSANEHEFLKEIQVQTSQHQYA